MKLRLEPKDVLVLSLEQQEKLRGMHKLHDGDNLLMPDGRIMVMGNGNIYYFDDSKVSFYYEDEMSSTNATDIEECILLLSIGDMMEIIREKKLHNVSGDNVLWCEGEPCDVLWRIIKSIL